MPLSQNDVLDEFRDAGALLDGHFILSSGVHSASYLQCARVLMDARRAARLCSELASRVTARFADEIEMVASPAMGGVVVGYEMGRQLEVLALFFERVDGNLAVRRGFEIPKSTRCLMVEDIVTTGLSSRECIAAIRDAGGEAIGAPCLIDRSGGSADIGVDLISLAELEIPTYQPDALPQTLLSLPAVKPGSRELKSR